MAHNYPKWPKNEQELCEPISLSLERALSSETGSQDPCSAHHAVVAWKHFMLLCRQHSLKNHKEKVKDVFLKFCSLQSFQAGAYFTNMRHGNKVKITSDVAKAPKKLTYFDSLKEAEIEHA